MVSLDSGSTERRGTAPTVRELRPLLEPASGHDLRRKHHRQPSLQPPLLPRRGELRGSQEAKVTQAAVSGKVTVGELVGRFGHASVTT